MKILFNKSFIIFKIKNYLSKNITIYETTKKNWGETEHFINGKGDTMIIKLGK